MTENDTDTSDARRKVRIEIPARMIREYDDGTARVDADGIEIPVESDEWRYVGSATDHSHK